MGKTNAGDALQLPECEHHFKFKRVEEEDVLRLLRQCDVKKAVGVDGISGKLLQLAAPAWHQSQPHSTIQFQIRIWAGSAKMEIMELILPLCQRTEVETPLKTFNQYQFSL